MLSSSFLWLPHQYYYGHESHFPQPGPRHPRRLTIQSPYSLSNSTPHHATPPAQRALPRAQSYSQEICQVLGSGPPPSASMVNSELSAALGREVPLGVCCLSVLREREKSWMGAGIRGPVPAQGLRKGPGVSLHSSFPLLFLSAMLPWVGGRREIKGTEREKQRKFLPPRGGRPNLRLPKSP